MSEEEEGVPLGSWRRLYTAVLINLAVLMLLAGLFSKWPY